LKTAVVLQGNCRRRRVIVGNCNYLLQVWRLIFHSIVDLLLINNFWSS